MATNPTSPDDSSDPFAGFELISVYTRQNAIDDQVLFDITDAARTSGFKIPIAATAAVYAYIDPSPELIAAGHSLAERTRLLLDVLYFAAAVYPDRSEVHFKVFFILSPGCPPEPVPLKALCHPGDDGEPVLTILLPNED